MIAIIDSIPRGPLRVPQQEIRAAFADGRRVGWTRSAHVESRVRPEAPSRAWLSSIARVWPPSVGEKRREVTLGTTVEMAVRVG